MITALCQSKVVFSGAGASAGGWKARKCKYTKLYKFDPSNFQVMGWEEHLQVCGALVACLQDLCKSVKTRGKRKTIQAVCSSLVQLAKLHLAQLEVPVLQMMLDLLLSTKVC